MLRADAVHRRSLLAGLALMPVMASRLGAQTPVSVVATTAMIADAAQRIGGGLTDVRALMGPGVDPHAYRQTRSDIAALSGADLVLWHGLHLEAQMIGLFADLATRRPVVAVAESLGPELLLSDPDYPDRKDPHVWMDPRLWSEVQGAVAGAIAALVPDATDDIAANLATYQADTARLNAYATEVMATVPPDARVLVTAHDAFAYFGRAFGIEVAGLQGISTESEAGLARVAQLVDLLVARKVPAVFVETSVSDRGLRALIEGAAAQGHDVAIGGSLFSDAMGPPGSYEGTWIGMIDHNVTRIVRALGGSAPERGMDGRLSP